MDLSRRPARPKYSLPVDKTMFNMILVTRMKMTIIIIIIIIIIIMVVVVVVAVVIVTVVVLELSMIIPSAVTLLLPCQCDSLS